MVKEEQFTLVYFRYIIYKKLDESAEQGCMITSYDANDNNILINDCTKALLTKLHYPLIRLRIQYILILNLLLISLVYILV